MRSWDVAGLASELALSLIAGFVVLVPLAVLVTSGTTDHDFARLVQVLLFAGCAVLAVLGGAAARLIVERRTVAVIAAVLVMGGLSIARAPDTARGVQEAALFAGMALVVLLLAGQTRSRLNRCLAWAVILSMSLQQGLQLLLALASLASDMPLHVDELPRGYGNHRFFNHVQTVALPLLVAAGQVLRERRLAGRLVSANLAVGVALLLLYFARASMLSLLLAAGMTLCWLPGGRLDWLRRWCWPVLGGVALHVVLFVLLPALSGEGGVLRAAATSGETMQDHGRLVMWQRALDFFAGSPWLGIGPMHYAHHPYPDAAHPHNIYLQWLAEWGGPVTALLCMAMVGWMWRAGSLLRSSGDAVEQVLRAGLWMAVAAGLVDAAFSGNLVMPVSQVWIALAWGWLLAQDSSGGAAVSHARIRVRLPMVLVWCLALLCVAGASLAMNEWGHLEPLLESSRELTRDSRFNPRFWSSGWF